MESANTVEIKESRVGEVKVGQAMAWERSGEDTEGSERKRETSLCGWRERDRKRGWSQPGRSSGVRCEEVPSVHGSEAPLRTEEGPRQTRAPLVWPK